MIEVLQDVFQILIWVMGFILIGLVLLQGGAGDVGSAFGGGGQLDGTLGVGANKKLAKLTGWLSFAFMCMVLVLAIDTTGGFDDDGAAPIPTPVVTDPEAHSGAPMPVDEGEPAVLEVHPDEATSAADEVAGPAQPEATPEDSAVEASEGTGVAFGEDDEDQDDHEDDETNED